MKASKKKNIYYLKMLSSSSENEFAVVLFLVKKEKKTVIGFTQFSSTNNTAGSIHSFKSLELFMLCYNENYKTMSSHFN